jgi:type I restriction enzyme S subunit
MRIDDQHLPDGWCRADIGSLGNYLNGRGFKKAEWSEDGRPIIRIQNLTGSSDKFNYFEGQVDPKCEIEPGDLLMSWAATLGAYIWRGPRAVLNQHIFKVDSFIQRRFHYFILLWALDAS